MTRTLQPEAPARAMRERAHLIETARTRPLSLSALDTYLADVRAWVLACCRVASKR